MRSFVDHFCSITIHPVGKMAQNCLVTWCKIPCQLTMLFPSTVAAISSRGHTADRINDTFKSSAAYYNFHAHNLARHPRWVTCCSSKFSLYTYWVVTKIGTHHRYYMKTTRHRVLVYNRYFLHCCIPTSVFRET